MTMTMMSMMVMMTVMTMMIDYNDPQAIFFVRKTYQWK